LRKEKEKVQEKKEERKNKSNNYYFLSKNTPLKFTLTSVLRIAYCVLRKEKEKKIKDSALSTKESIVLSLRGAKRRSNPKKYNILYLT